MEKSFKNSVGVKGAKFLLGGMASLGAGAVVGCIVRNQNLSSLKGFGKLFAGIGISGLSIWCGNEARNAIAGQIDEIASGADMAAEIFEDVKTSIENEEVPKEPVEETETADDTSLLG